MAGTQLTPNLIERKRTAAEHQPTREYPEALQQSCLLFVHADLPCVWLSSKGTPWFPSGAHTTLADNAESLFDLGLSNPGGERISLGHQWVLVCNLMTLG